MAAGNNKRSIFSPKKNRRYKKDARRLKKKKTREKAYASRRHARNTWTTSTRGAYSFSALPGVSGA